jgi:ParB-like chromosome segregation protein Spo0J
MPRTSATSLVKMAFEGEGLRIAIADIQPLKLVSEAIKKTPKYAQIAASIREVGIIEPPILARDQSDPGKYLLLDGHLRIDVLKDMGQTDVTCLISTDDEAFTYNKRVNRLAMIQEHRMILKAVERGVPEERIAKALNVDVASIVRKRRLLDGICPEVAELLKDKHIAIHTFTEFKKLAPLRQIEAAELMVAMNKYTISYAKSLVAATPQAQLAEADKPKRVSGFPVAPGRYERVRLNERQAAASVSRWPAGIALLIPYAGYGSNNTKPRSGAGFVHCGAPGRAAAGCNAL